MSTTSDVMEGFGPDPDRVKAAYRVGATGTDKSPDVQ
jgi:hypothetical protein